MGIEQALTLGNSTDITNIVLEIIENLDELAVSELVSGSESDVDKIMEILWEEATSVVAVKNRKIDAARFDTLDPLVDSIEDTLRRDSLSYFLLSVMPEFQLNTHHLEWGNLVQLYPLLSVLASRGSGKSFYFSKGYILWKLFRYMRDNKYGVAPEKYSFGKEGILITNEYKLALHLLSIVKEEIEENEILRELLYPEGRRDGWGAESIRTKNGAKVTAKSVGSKMRGFHPHWIVCDDYLNDSVLYSSEQNSKYIQHFHSVVMNMIEPGGQVVVVGTPFRENDLYANLKKLLRWKVFEYPAIYPDGSLLWEERLPFDSILEKRESQGSVIFSREILVRPISTESTLFPYNTLKMCFDESLAMISSIHQAKYKYKKVVLSADFAVSANIGADYSVFTVLGVTDNDHYHILDMWRKSGATYDEQVGQIKRMYSDFKPDVVLIEDNGMQKVFEQMLNDNGVPATGQTTTAQKKYHMMDGVPAMAALFEQGRIHIPRGSQKSIDMTDILVGELSNFTWDESKGKIQGVGDHDDTCMSLWIGICATKIGTFEFYFV